MNVELDIGESIEDFSLGASTGVENEQDGNSSNENDNNDDNSNENARGNESMNLDEIDNEKVKTATGKHKQNDKKRKENANEKENETFNDNSNNNRNENDNSSNSEIDSDDEGGMTIVSTGNEVRFLLCHPCVILQDSFFCCANHTKTFFRVICFVFCCFLLFLGIATSGKRTVMW
jgi:hypothetical protein